MKYMYLINIILNIDSHLYSWGVQADKQSISYGFSVRRLRWTTLSSKYPFLIDITGK